MMVMTVMMLWRRARRGQWPRPRQTETGRESQAPCGNDGLLQCPAPIPVPFPHYRPCPRQEIMHTGMASVGLQMTSDCRAQVSQMPNFGFGCRV